MLLIGLSLAGPLATFAQGQTARLSPADELAAEFTDPPTTSQIFSEGCIDASAVD
jgi:hypothetical protein